MSRKEKPPAKRSKRVYETPTYTTGELCARHRISRRTLRRWGVEREFPTGWMSGKNMVYAKQAVHDWERKHTPELHTEAEMSDEDKRWDLMRRRHLLEKEEREAGIEPPPPPPRPRRAAART